MQQEGTATHIVYLYVNNLIKKGWLHFFYYRKSNSIPNAYKYIFYNINL